MEQYFELNIDGLVGSTHNYAGLSYGNVASKNNSKSISKPKEAALQGLKKMKTLKDLGFKQAVFAPQQRPNLSFLKQCGYSGTDKELLNKADPILLAVASSAACMWTANAATVSPSSDTADRKVHLTPANLSSNAHRAQEPGTTYQLLKSMFANKEYFTVHKPIMGGDAFGDEGAANFIRLCENHGSKGLEVFVYGKIAFDSRAPAPRKYPARQSKESFEAIARSHRVKESYFIQQNPAVIDQGVFHNDVISVGNERVLFYHEEAFLNTAEIIRDLENKLPWVEAIKVSNKDVSVEEAVKTYLFNTQLLTKENGKMLIVAPCECQESRTVSNYLDALIRDNDNSIDEVLYFDLKQSMRNGGGPACLRLRVAMSETEFAKMNQGVVLTDSLYDSLVVWVNKFYRDEITPNDLRDYKLYQENMDSLDELTKILKLGNVYEFQT